MKEMIIPYSGRPIKMVDKRARDQSKPSGVLNGFICLDVKGTHRTENALRMVATGSNAELAMYLGMGSLERLLDWWNRVLESPLDFAELVQRYYGSNQAGVLPRLVFQSDSEPYLGRDGVDIAQLTFLFGAEEPPRLVKAAIRNNMAGIKAQFRKDDPFWVDHRALSPHVEQFWEDQIEGMGQLATRLHYNRFGQRQNYRPPVAGYDFIVSELHTWANYVLTKYANEAGIPQFYSTPDFDRDDEDLLWQQLHGLVPTRRKDALTPQASKDMNFDMYASYSSPWRSLTGLINFLHLTSTLIGQQRLLSEEQMQTVLEQQNLQYSNRELTRKSTLTYLVQTSLDCGYVSMPVSMRERLFEELARRINSAEPLDDRLLIPLFDHLVVNITEIGESVFLYKLLVELIVKMIGQRGRAKNFFKKFYELGDIALWHVDSQIAVLEKTFIHDIPIAGYATHTSGVKFPQRNIAKHIAGQIKNFALGSNPGVIES